MKKMKNNKAKVLAVFLVCSAILTSCGASYKSSSPSMTANSKGIFQNGFAATDSAAGESYNYDSYDDGGYYEESAASDSVIYADEAENKQKGVSGENINREMLVYSCSMDVDVLDFDGASKDFKVKLEQYQGFVESENLSDGSSYSRYYFSDAEKWHKYTATVRVPSRVYDDFCNAVSELGDLRSKNASVENVSQEYSDLSTTLEIYEKKEDRYLEMLANAKDEVNAVAIEDKLTDIQVEIAHIKTRMNQIKTDVAYSYVYITINEVKEYQEEPVRTDTFGQRLVNTLKDAGSGFLGFLEDLLFFLIYAVPYLVLIGLGVFVFIKIVRVLVNASRKRKEKKEQKLKSMISASPDVPDKKEVKAEEVTSEDTESKKD